jgi:rare lipoprotein A (peptidoglycan hydrolase)
MVIFALSRKGFAVAVSMCAIVCMLASCAPYQARKRGQLYKADGLASWYGPGFNGRRTSSGERYNQREMTAAHKTLPFGSAVKVTNVENGKSCVVRINDRGPFVRGRVIDLSKAAALKLDMVGAGTARVKLATLGADEVKQSAVAGEVKPHATKQSTKKKTGAQRFVPPPPPSGDDQPKKRKDMSLSPPDDPATQDLDELKDTVEEETGMPAEEDRF